MLTNYPTTQIMDGYKQQFNPRSEDPDISLIFANMLGKHLDAVIMQEINTEDVDFILLESRINGQEQESQANKSNLRNS